MGRVRTHHTLRRPRPQGGAVVLDYVESTDWRGWYAHEFDWTGRYVAVRRCGSQEVLDALGADAAQFSEPRRSQQ
jgi:hypothetical protein